MKECIQCGTPMGVDEMFCSVCGTDQRAEVRGQGSEDRRQETEGAVESQMSNVECQKSKGEDVSLRTDHSELLSGHPLPSVNCQPSAPLPSGGLDSADSGVFPPPLIESECEDLQVFYNSQLVLLEGMRCTFGFRVKPLRDDIRHLEIRVKSDCGINAVCSRRSLKKEREMVAGALVPETNASGLNVLEIMLSYKKGGRSHSYFHAFTQHVHRREIESAKNINIEVSGHANDLNLNGLNNDNIDIGVIRQGPAGDISLSAIQGMAEKGKWNLLQDELSKLSPLWKELSFEEDETSCDPMTCRGLIGDPSPAAKVHQLTLADGGRKIHLISGDRVQLGRNRDSEITTRIFDEAGNMPREENLYISKFHCGFVKEGTTVKIQDGSVRTNDPKGKTWVNGKPLLGSILLPSGKVQISFGRPGSTERLFSVSSKLLLSRREDGMSEPAGILLKRNDHVPECWLIVYDRIALKALGPDWDGWCIGRHKGGYCFGREGGCKWLIPGSNEFVGSKLIEVTSFRQYGL